MRRQNSDGLRSRCARWFCAIGLMFNGILLMAASSHAGVLDVSWIAPIANHDGSPLTDLALFRVYYGIFDFPCPGSTFVEVASSTSVPAANQEINFQLTGLTAGSFYSVSVTAMDSHGNESACSGTASAVARDDLAATPSSGIAQEQSVVQSVAIAIRPRRDANRINPNSSGLVQVAILTDNNGFDATTVLPDTLRFGPTGTEAAPSNFLFRDVDGDGNTDIVLRFLIQDSAIQCGQTAAFIKGQTSAGKLIQGSDFIRTVGCSK